MTRKFCGPSSSYQWCKGGGRCWFIRSTKQDNTSFRRHVLYVTNFLVKAALTESRAISGGTDVPNTASSSSDPEYQGQLDRMTYPVLFNQWYGYQWMVVWCYANQNLYLRVSFCRWNSSCELQQTGSKLTLKSPN